MAMPSVLRNPAAIRRAIRLGTAAPVPPDPTARVVVYGPASMHDHAASRLLDIDARIYVRTPAAAPHRAVCFNPSVIVWDGALLVSLRTFVDGVRPYSHVVLVRMTDDWRFEHARLAQGQIATLLGLEDVRLFVMGGKLMGTATTSHNQLSVVEFSSSGDVETVRPQPPGAHKNWAPVLDGSGRILFSPHGAVMTLKPGSRFVTPLPTGMRFSDWLRGGSQLVPYGDGFIAVVHESVDVGGRQRRIYLHRFIRYDASLKVEHVSPPFTFERQGIEFACGLAQWHGRWVISYGVEDRECRLVIVSTEVVAGMVGRPEPRQQRR